MKVIVRLMAGIELIYHFTHCCLPYLIFVNDFKRIMDGYKLFKWALKMVGKRPKKRLPSTYTMWALCYMLQALDST
jgi:hypothetical protein